MKELDVVFFGGKLLKNFFALENEAQIIMSTSNPTLHEVTSEYLNGFIMTRMSFTTIKTIYCSLK